jgi:hypothetical protein
MQTYPSGSPRGIYSEAIPLNGLKENEFFHVSSISIFIRMLVKGNTHALVIMLRNMLQLP